MKRVLPPTYFMLSVVLMVLLAILAPIGSLTGFPWNMSGIVPIGIGLILNVLADRQFKDAQTTVKPFEESASLVTDGVFGFSRNPMYLGIVAMLIGLALLLDSQSPWIIVIGFFLLINFRFIRTEELMLVEKFGDDFIRYRNSVRKWI